MQALKIIALFLFFSPISFGQISFYNTYSDNGYDEGEGIVQLPDSSYLITGSSSSFTSNSQAFILKIDSLGNRLWSKNYGGNESDRGRRIFAVPNDGIYIAGQTNSFGNFYDAYFLKTDFSGNLIYQKHYGSSKYENIHDGVMLKDTSFLLVGETYNTINEVENIYLLRVNKLGDTLWTKNFGSEGKDVARGIKMLNDTTVIIVGEYYVTDSLTQKAMVLRMHINGTQEWLKTYGDSGKYVLNDVSIENNEIRACGYNYNENYLNGFSRNYLFKSDEFGLNVFQISEDHNGNFAFQCMTHFGNNPNDYYITTQVNNSDVIPTYPDGSEDIIIDKFNANFIFNVVGFNTSNLGDDIPNEIIATSDGGAILIGSNQKQNIGGSNVLVAKIGANDYFPYSNTIPTNKTLVSVNELVKKESLKIFPNPTQDLLGLNIENNKKVSIYNQLGELLFEEKITNSQIDVSRLKAGIYFVKCENNFAKFIKK